MTSLYPPFVAECIYYCCSAPCRFCCVQGVLTSVGVHFPLSLKALTVAPQHVCLSICLPFTVSSAAPPSSPLRASLTSSMLSSAHLCIAVAICGSLRADPSACWRGPAGGRAGSSVRCAAGSPVLRSRTPWLMLQTQTRRDNKEEVSVDRNILFCRP